MSQQRPPGRRRAHDEADAPRPQPASFADLATMWRSVSHAHAAVDHHRRHFVNTPVDDRLAEQLSLLPVLHDWESVTEGEAHEVSYLLGLYADPPVDAPRDEVAHALIATIRQMAGRRGSGTRSG